MKVKITTSRLNSLNEGDILELGADKEMDRKLATLIDNGEAVFINDEVKKIKKEAKKPVKRVKKVKK